MTTLAVELKLSTNEIMFELFLCAPKIATFGHYLDTILFCIEHGSLHYGLHITHGFKYAKICIFIQIVVGMQILLKQKRL